MAIRTAASRRRAFAVLVVLTLATIQLQLVGAGSANASAACNGAFSGMPQGTLAISSSVPNGATITAGQSITITATWATTDWSGLDAYYNCWQLNGAQLNALELEEKPPANDGTVTQTISVPGTVANGDELCVRSRLSGQPAAGNTTTQKSNKLCWTVGTVVTNPDVIIRKSASATNVNAGQGFNYTLEVENIGTADATGVTITDTIPSSLTIGTLPANCSRNGQVVTCTMGTVSPGAANKKSVTIPVTTTNGSCPSVVNNGTVTAGNEPAGNTGNNQSNNVTVNVACQVTNPDVIIRKSASATNVNAGQGFNYTLEVENIGTADATGVTITDTIPSSLTIGTLPANCSRNGQVVTCTMGTVSPGAANKKSVTIPVTTTNGSCPSVVNNGTVTAGNEPAGNTGNNQSNNVTVNVACQTPDVVVRKSASAAQVNAGNSVTFTLTAENTGGADATNVSITDTFAAGLTIGAVSNGCTIAGQTVTCALGTLTPGQTKSVTVTVTATATACPSVQNNASVSAGNEPAGSTGNNVSNTVTLNVVCPNPDVEIIKRSDAPDSGVFSGEQFTYTIVVQNVSGGDVTGVMVHDSIPAGLDIVDMSAECTATGQDVTCDLGTVAAGQSEQVTITVEATDAACPEVTNTATVTAGNDSNSGNNTSEPITDIVNCVEPGIAIRITKTNDANNDGRYTDNEEAKRAGLDVPFKVVITNTGEETVVITDLTDTFPQDVIDLLDAKCAQLDGVSLDPGESVKCLFTVNNYSPSSDAGAKINVAEVCVEMDGDATLTDCDDDDSRVRSAEVLGRTVTPPPTRTPPGGTAFTGSEGTLTFGLLAMALLLFGSGVMYVGYRKRQRYDA